MKSGWAISQVCGQLFLLMIGWIGCTVLPVVSNVIFEDHDRLVRVDVTYRTGSQEHSHPSALSPAELSTVLRAINTTPQRDLLAGRLGVQTSTSPRAFSEEQVQFLAPLLVQGLNQATPLEEVVFYLNRQRDSNIREITSGSLYLEGYDLHLILANFRYTTVGQVEAGRVRSNPLIILGIPRYELNAGPHSTASDPKSWLKVFATSPQHLIIDYQALIKSGVKIGEENTKIQDIDFAQ